MTKEGQIFLNYFRRKLLCAEYSVTGITETGNNVAVLIKSLIKSSAENINIWMSRRKSFKALGSGNNTHKFN